MASSTRERFWKQLLYIPLLINFLTPQIAVTVGGKTATDEYYYMTFNYAVDLKNPSRTILGESEILCARMCSVDANCECFVWDILDGSCTTGRCSSSSAVLPDGAKKVYRTSRPITAITTTTTTTTTATSITKSRYCKVAGYMPLIFIGTKSCFYISDHRLVHSAAKSKCQRDGGDLMKTNTAGITWQMVQIAASASSLYEDGLFIGLDDLTTPGTLTWSDGAALTHAEKKDLFGEGEPFKSDIKLHCMCASPELTSPRVMGCACDEGRIYICQMDAIN